MSESRQVDEFAALERPRVTQTREPRRYRRPRAQQPPVAFQMLQCKHHAQSAALLLTGRTQEGKHVTVNVPDPEYTFYLQRAAPFGDRHGSAAAFLAALEDLLVGYCETGFTIPTKGGDPATNRETISVSRALWPRQGDRSRLRISGWAHASGVFRTMYGWTPPEARLDNLLAVYVRDPRLVRVYTQFIDSEEYLRAVGALPGGKHPAAIVRAFQGAAIEPEIRLRMQQKITLGGWVALTRYYTKPADLSPLYTDRYYVADGGLTALKPLPERTGTAPLRVVSYDIEADGRDGRFPAPCWNVPRLLDYLNSVRHVPKPQLNYARAELAKKAILLGMTRKESETAPFARLRDYVLGDVDDEVRAKNPAFKTLKAAGLSPRTFRSVTDLRQTFKREYPRTVGAWVPEDTDTDPAFLIVAVEWIYGKNRDLTFARQQALLFRHPQQATPYDRPPGHRFIPPEEIEARAGLDSKWLPDQYRTLPVRELDTEAGMILAFAELLHEWKPDIVSGWNTTGFDFPFLYERYEFLKQKGNFAEKRAIEAGSKLNFGLVRDGSSYAREETKSTNAGGDRSYLKVSTDYLSHLDGQVVWSNTSFGEREERGNKLDLVAESRLQYPGTTVPRRKLEVDVKKGGEYWRAGGRRLWIFIAYCAVDARLPVQLLLKRGKISMAVGLARLANVTLHAVYANGLQMKVVSMLAQEYYEHRGNRELLVEYGRRHFHWPDTWLRAEKAAGLHAPTARPADNDRGTKRPAEWDLPATAAKRARTDVGTDPPSGSDAEWPDEGGDEGPGGMKRPREPSESEEEDPARARKRARLHRLRHAMKRKRVANAIDASVLPFVYKNPRFQPVPKGMKGYEGAHVFEPTRGFHEDLIATADFASLYPFIIISHFLSYMTFLTSTTIEHYQIPRHHYTTVPLGEARRIFCGEATYDPATAAANEYTSPEIKVAHFYVDADNAFRNMLLRVYALRKKYKADMAQWKLYKLVLAKGADPAAARAAWLADADTLPGADSYIENGRVFARLERAVQDSDEAYAALHAEAWAAVDGDNVVDPVAAADNQASVANATQLACKFFINGAYGFTTASAKIAMVPLMEIGAAVTSYGRVCIRSSSYAGDHLTVPELLEAMDYRAREDLEQVLAEWLADRDGVPVPLAPPTNEEVVRERERVQKDHARLAGQALYTHGGDTDSIMLGYPAGHAGRDVPKVIKMATFVAAWIDQYMRDQMVLEQEKTSKKTAFFGRKNYFMDLFGDPKILYKGFEPVRRDTLPFVRITVVRSVECLLGRRLPPGSTLAAVPETHEERVREIVAYMKRRLMALARGEIPVAELTQSQQIRKLVYEAPPVAMGAVAKMQSRGQHVQVGDRVLFVFRRPDATEESDKKIVRRKAKSYISSNKARDLADDVTHVIQNNIPLDYEHYYQKKVKNPLRKLMRPLLAPVLDFPVIQIGMSPAQVKEVEKRASKVKNWQNAQVDKELFAEADEFFAHRRRVTYKHTLNRRNRQRALAIEYECPVCADFFTVFAKNAPLKPSTEGGICTGCQARRQELVTETEALARANRAATEEKLDTCRDCIRRTGFEEDIEPEECRKYFCSVFEAREALSITKKQLRRRLENLGVTDPAQLEW